MSGINQHATFHLFCVSVGLQRRYSLHSMEEDVRPTSFSAGPHTLLSGTHQLPSIQQHPKTNYPRIDALKVIFID